MNTSWKQIGLDALRSFFLVDEVSRFLRFNRSKQVLSDRILPYLAVALASMSVTLLFLANDAFVIAEQLPGNWPGIVGASAILLAGCLLAGGAFFLAVAWYESPSNRNDAS
jgi:hypothetical protein